MTVCSSRSDLVEQSSHAQLFAEIKEPKLQLDSGN
jgi:hypothetical protein